MTLPLSLNNDSPRRNIFMAFRKILHYWRIFVVIVLITWGLFLIMPAFRIMPVIINVVFARINQSGPIDDVSVHIRPTPFQPVPINRMYLPLVNQAGFTQDESPFLPLKFDIGGIDFSPHAQHIVIRIIPEDRQINSGKPVDIAFLPGEQCDYGDGKACVYSYFSSNGSRVVFVSVHSGLGGEGEQLRDALEGTGINQGLHTPDRVNRNIRALFGSGITLFQGEMESAGHELIAVARIPPEHLEEYLALSVEKTIDFAVHTSSLETTSLPAELLVIETCGWWLPGDRPAPGIRDTTGSVYLGLVRIDS